jgi:glutamate-ammonia-ligase adenylyltransferase
MIDELLDSLMLNRLPTEQQLGKMLHELCRGADDIDPIVHSFKNARHLNVGVRDILGKESIADTHRALADIADVCLQQTVHTQYSLLVKRFGVPTKADNDACRFAVVAMGKLGGREPNYHSDVSLLFLYDQEGTTKPFGAIRHHEPIAAEYFFHQLAQKVSQVANRVGRSGRLYETKNWLVSPNRNTTLAWSLEEIHRFFCNTPGLALQRQQLCNARCIVGDPDFQQEVHLSIRTILKTRMWTGEDKELVLSERKRLEESAGERNLKRGKGGTMDVEPLVHLLILEHLADNEDLLVNGTLEAIERLRLHGLIESTDADTLRDGYNFLRGVESGLRLMNTLARHDLPSSEIELSRLAYVLKLHNGPELEEACNRYRGMHRALYEKYL